MAFVRAGGQLPGSKYYTTSSTGGNGLHNNIQPYVTVYFWKRTA